MNRSRTIPVLLVTLAVFAVGFAGATAGQAAGPITKAQVKKIAKSVVKSQGKKLTVADSKKLGGKPPIAFQDNAQLFTADVTAPVDNVHVALPLLPGKYLVSWSAYFIGLTVSTGRAGCYITNDQGAASSTYSADDVSEAGNPVVGYSGAGYVDVTAGDVASLDCFGPGTFTTSPTDPLAVTVVPLDVATATTLSFTTAPRPASRR